MQVSFTLAQMLNITCISLYIIQSLWVTNKNLYLKAYKSAFYTGHMKLQIATEKKY